MASRFRFLIPALAIVAALGLGGCSDDDDQAEIGEEFQEQGEQIGEELGD